MTMGSRLSRRRSRGDERHRQTVLGRARRRYLRCRHPRAAQHRRPRRYSCRLARQPSAALSRPADDRPAAPGLYQSVRGARIQSRGADRQAISHAATHSSAGRAHKGFEQVDDVSRVPGARQPMVRTHPETGKKALFLGRRINAYVIGLPVAESEELLNELWTDTTEKKYTWTQEWKVDDLVWWDNRCVMHRRDAFDPETRRLMHRTQLKGTRPI